MPLQINPNDYGFANAAELAKIAGTLQGEAKVGGNLYDRAVIADVLFNRANSPQFKAYSKFTDGGNTFTGAVAQASVPSQFNVWMPTIAGKANGGYQSGTEMQGIISNLIQDPTSWDRLSPAQQQNVSMNLTALRGVFGSYDPNKGNLPNGEGTYTPQGGPLQGLTGGATYYSNPKYNAPGQMATHIGLGLNQGVNQGDNVFYAGTPAKTQEMAQRMKAFDRLQAATELSVGDATEGGFRENDAGMLARMAFKGPDLPANGTSLPLPPGRPSDADLQSYAQALQGGPVDRFSDSITRGLQQAGSSILDTFANATGRLPTSDQFRARMDDFQSGARGLFDQLTDIAGSQEAKTFAQSTGIDPSQYVVNDIYRLGLGRDADTSSQPWAMDVLHNHGGQGLFNNLANSQEGRTYALNNFYGSAFNRDIDQGGLDNWLAQLNSGKTLQSVESQILGSPEAQAQPASLRDQLANLITPSFLTPTIGFAGATAGTLGSGTDAGTIGAPGISPIINDLYQGILQRAPDAQGAQAYQGELASGVPADLIQAQILNSAEAAQTLGPDRLASMLNDYQTAHGRSADTAATLAPLASEYSQTLNRGIDAPTLQAWGQQIQSGTPSSIMEAQLLAAPEVQQARTGSLDSLTSQYQAKYGLLPTEVNTLSPLASQFQQALQRGVDTPTLQAWDAQLDAGTPLSILQAQLFGAPEVQARGSDALAPLINNYQTQYGMAPQEVAALAPLASQFSQLLGRPADTPTLQAWDAQIDAGTSMPTLQAQLLQAPEVTARTGGQGDLYNAFQSQYGRSASDYLAGLSNPTGFTGINTSGSVGPGTFSGTFDPTQYLAANRDVAASGMDPLTHYLTYGYNEGRALDTAGDRINKGFDASAYLNANPDVAAAHVDPLYQYITSGASEGRAMPTGSNPYSFSGINVGQGVGAGTFSGSFNPSQYLAANRDVAASGMDPLTHYLTYGFNEGRALDTKGDKINQGFDPTAYLGSNPDVAAAHLDPLAHYLEFGAHEGRALPTGINPYSFTNLNAGGYQIPNGSGSGAVGSLSVNNASGAANGLSGSGGASGSAFDYTDSAGNPQVATFNPHQAEMNYLQGQVNQTNQMIAAGQQETANNPNAANGALANIGFGIQTAINPTAGLGAGIQNFGSNAAIGTYSMPAATPLPTIPVLPGGLRGTAAIGGYPGGNGFGGAGGFF